MIRLASIASLTLAATAQAAPSPVTRVVLHPDGAVVTRTLELACQSGSATAAFDGLLPVFDPAALRASASPAPARVEGIAVAQRVLEEPFDDAVRALDRELETLHARELGLRREREEADAAAGRAEALRNVAVPFIAREGGQQPKPNTEAWTSALDTVRKQVDDANSRRQKVDRDQRALAKTLEEVQSKRNRLAAAAPRAAIDADVVVTCGTAPRVKVELSYTTPHARWSPAYEARLDESAGTVGMTLLANAEQRTGEAWTNVEIALSTAQSTRDAKPPVMQTLRVGASKEEERKKVLVQRQEQQEHVNGGAVGNAANTAGFAAEDQGLSVQLKVPGRVELAGDGTPARMQVDTVTAAAKPGLLTIPKLAPYAFRSTELANTARYPWLAGPADLFTANGFLGSMPLTRTAQNDRVRLSFGIDEAVKVKRVVLAEDKLEPGFLQNTKRLVYGYRIELESNAKGSVTVAIHEPVPVSEIEDVKLTIDAKKTTAGFRHVTEDGRLEWSVTLQPREKKAIELHFTVEIPGRYDTAGL